MVNSVLNLDHRRKMMALEKAIIGTENTVELEVKHYFAHFTYVRELLIPKGIVLTGKIHRYSCVNILSKGHVKVITDEGDYEVKAPFTMVTCPGSKKAFAAIEESVWLNVHPWNGTDTLEQIEEKLIIPSYEALDSESKEQALCLG